MSSAPRYIPRYTVEDYCRWEGAWELWDGIAIAMTPSPCGKHQRVAARLLYQLQRGIELSGCRAEAAFETDWIVAEDTVVRPDVVVMCEGIPERYIETTPALVGEILSASTARRDRSFKSDLYQAQGVEIYLVVDPEQSTMEVGRRDRDGHWTMDLVHDSATIELCDDCQMELKAASLF